MYFPSCSSFKETEFAFKLVESFVGKFWNITDTLCRDTLLDIK